jgi:hypothetical protein
VYVVLPAPDISHFLSTLWWAKNLIKILVIIKGRPIISKPTTCTRCSCSLPLPFCWAISVKTVHGQEYCPLPVGPNLTNSNTTVISTCSFFRRPFHACQKTIAALLFYSRRNKQRNLVYYAILDWKAKQLIHLWFPQTWECTLGVSSRFSSGL